MRAFAAKCPFAFFLVALVCLAFASAQLAFPARVHCREIPYGSEEGGDPDMPDQVMSIKVEAGDRVPTLDVRPEAGAPRWNQSWFEPPVRANQAFSRDAIYREILVQLWVSLTSIGLAY